MIEQNIIAPYQRILRWRLNKLDIPSDINKSKLLEILINELKQELFDETHMVPHDAFKTSIDEFIKDRITVLTEQKKIKRKNVKPDRKLKLDVCSLPRDISSIPQKMIDKFDYISSLFEESVRLSIVDDKRTKIKNNRNVLYVESCIKLDKIAKEHSKKHV